MRFALWTVLLAGLAVPAVAQAPPALVTLTLAPGQVTKGTPITITSTVRPRAMTVSEGRSSPYDPLGLVYTFTAQRSWPCQESFTIQSSNRSTATWNAPKAGTYTFAVDVKYKPTVYVGGMPKFLPAENLGNATHANYEVKPQMGFSHNITKKVTGLPYGPASAVRFLELTIANPPTSHWFRFQYTCYGGCSPASGTNRGGSGTTFMVTLENAGMNSFRIDVDKVRLSDCEWLQSSGPIVYNYNYVPPVATASAP